MKNKEFIDKFIKEIRKNYPSLNIGSDYYKELEQHDIWHTDESLDSDDKFRDYTSGLAKILLFDKGVFNFSFGYDHSKLLKDSN